MVLQSLKLSSILVSVSGIGTTKIAIYGQAVAPALERRGKFIAGSS